MPVPSLNTRQPYLQVERANGYVLQVLLDNAEPKTVRDAIAGLTELLPTERQKLRQAYAAAHVRNQEKATAVAFGNRITATVVQPKRRAPSAVDQLIAALSKRR